MTFEKGNGQGGRGSLRPRFSGNMRGANSERRRKGTKEARTDCGNDALVNENRRLTKRAEDLQE